MKAKHLIIMTIVTLMALDAETANAQEGSRNKVSGSYTTSFMRFDFVGAPDGAPIFDVLLMGPFSLTINGEVRSGIVHFPHLLQFPVDPNGEGTLSGSVAWLFDDGLTCLGSIDHSIGADGFSGRGRFECSDGSRLDMDINDEDVIPGVSVTASLNGMFKRRRD